MSGPAVNYSLFECHQDFFEDCLDIYQETHSFKEQAVATVVMPLLYVFHVGWWALNKVDCITTDLQNRAKEERRLRTVNPVTGFTGAQEDRLCDLHLEEQRLGREIARLKALEKDS